ncbi:MAG TPA: aminotransferase class V-fold PLP-dependent enzyme, partial [Planctomycetota bacterium]|nr:aminotransferase class V-fold PLP-dependent enzyme [Planctomycetota bacterium]
MCAYEPISDVEAAFWRDVRRRFTLPDDEIYLNSGSLSSIPRCTLEAQVEALRRSERNPAVENVLNWAREDAARARIARYVGARPDELVFFSNVTIALNALIRGLPLDGGEAILSDQEYTSCINALRFVAERRNMTVRQFPMPLTPAEPDEVVRSVLSALGKDTRLVYLSHIVYGTGMVVPVASIARELASRGVLLAVDGAHAPGQVPLDLGTMPVSAYG